MVSAPLRWGIIGVGIAGAARSRAIAADPRAVAVGGHRGAPEAAGLVAFDDLDALIEACDALAVCSPDATHPARVERCLRAGRHVLCEYPLAPTGAEARRLFALADELGLGLHVEHIELLTHPARFLRVVARPDALRGGSLRWVSPPRADQPRLAHANLARLHRLVDAVGFPRRIDVQQADPDLLSAQLRFDNGAHVELGLRAEAGAKRHLELTLVLAGGVAMQVGSTLLWRGAPQVAPAGAPGLFAADQLAASAYLIDGATTYISRDRVCALLDLADNLEKAAEHARLRQAAAR
jgi:hypothetical protein